MYATKGRVWWMIKFFGFQILVSFIADQVFFSTTSYVDSQSAIRLQQDKHELVTLTHSYQLADVKAFKTANKNI